MENPVDALRQLSAGYYVSRALNAVADLGVADALGRVRRSMTCACEAHIGIGASVPTSVPNAVPGPSSGGQRQPS
jgi:hypothetical protein